MTRSPNTNLGMALLEQGRVDEALGQCEMALETNPESFAVHCNVGVVISQRDKSTVPEDLAIEPDFGLHNIV
jgi:hypothetical protein